MAKVKTKRMDLWWQRLRAGMNRGQTPVNGTVELTLRRIYILPTRRGLGMVFTILLLLLTAFIYNNNLVYLLAFLVAGIFFVTILHTFRNVAGLSIRVGNAQPVFAGETARVPVVVANAIRLERETLVMHLNDELGCSLAALETRRLHIPVTAIRRGWQALETLTISGQFPLGLFRAWSPIRFEAGVLVYPRPSQQTLPFPEPADEPGVAAKHHKRTGSDDFNGIRGYQRGDSPRQIYWKAYAKGQGLYSKQYADHLSGNRHLWLSLEQTSGHDLEERLSQLCRWIVDAESAGLRYALRLPKVSVELGQGAAHLERCLAALAEV
jgi:uncharacterized protein (DUF58 family)